MNKKLKKKEESLVVEYNALREQDKSYILGVAKALEFAAKNEAYALPEEVKKKIKVRREKS